MAKTKPKAKKATKEKFVDAFSKHLAKHPVVQEKHKERTMHAIMMIVEYIRTYYDLPRSADSVEKLDRYCHNLLVLETCDQADIQKSVCDAELRVLNECMTHMTGLNGIELALNFKASTFKPVRASADQLMNICTSKQVISNGMA